MRREQAFELVRQANPMSEGSSAPAGFLSPTALLDRIDERSTDMQTRENQTVVKPRRPDASPKRTGRGWLRAALAAGAVVIVAVAVAVALPGGGDVSQPPLEVVEALDAATVAGDWEAVRELYADDATYTRVDDGFGHDYVRHGKDEVGQDNMPLTSPGIDARNAPLTSIYPPFDWDGDGSVTGFDDLASLTMANYAWGMTRYYSCTQPDATTVVCDLVLEGHALWPEAQPVTDTFTVIDGLITHQVYDTTGAPGDPKADPFETRLDYLGYIEDNHPELEGTLFSQRLGELRMTPESAELHRQFIAEWRAQR